MTGPVLRFLRGGRFCYASVATSARLLLLAFSLALFPAIGHAQNEPTPIDIQVEELATQLRCPVCQGLSIADSPSEINHTGALFSKPA